MKAINQTDLALFQSLLIGTWKNAPPLIYTDPVAKRTVPLSYNVMPLPQVLPPASRPAPGYGGFILKNFTFTETIRFNGCVKKGLPAQYVDQEALAVSASAPNRGGTYTQLSRALFYAQQIRFAEGPEGPRPASPDGDIVHVENGAWLHLGSEPQIISPFGPAPQIPGPVLNQPPYATIAKQISVPHGNSVLALGNVDLYDENHFSANPAGTSAATVIPHAPSIADAIAPYPTPSDIVAPPHVDAYATKLVLPLPDYENPDPAWTLNPNYPLQLALKIIQPNAYIHWRVTTQPLFTSPSAFLQSGSVTNIPFEDHKARVTDYWADYWLLSKDSGKKFDYLAYTQTMLMEMKVSLDGGRTFKAYIFPHVTSNTVQRVPGDPNAARQATLTPLQP